MKQLLFITRWRFSLTFAWVPWKFYQDIQFTVTSSYICAKYICLQPILWEPSNHHTYKMFFRLCFYSYKYRHIKILIRHSRASTVEVRDRQQFKILVTWCEWIESIHPLGKTTVTLWIVALSCPIPSFTEVKNWKDECTCFCQEIALWRSHTWWMLERKLWTMDHCSCLLSMQFANAFPTITSHCHLRMHPN